jgi:uncharacterized protein
MGMNDVNNLNGASSEPIMRDNPEASTYEAVFGDQVVGTVFYERVHDQAGKRIIIRSTVVDPRMRGHGIGSKIVKAALDDVRAKGETLTSYCSFVDEYIADHAEYADLVHGFRSGPV